VKMNGPARVFFAAAALSILSLSEPPAQAARCGPCDLVQQRCSANCFGLDREQIGGCLIACDNEAATCSCDEAVTLSSEAFLAKSGSGSGPRVITAFADACHSTVPCGTEYGSCAGWSSYVDCDEPRCAFHVQGCGPCGPEDPCFGPGLRQNLERYRVCFNEQQQGCTEYQRTSWIVGCDC
jgi:hypothetical protein